MTNFNIFIHIKKHLLPPWISDSSRQAGSQTKSKFRIWRWEGRQSGQFRRRKCVPNCACVQNGGTVSCVLNKVQQSKLLIAWCMYIFTRDFSACLFCHEQVNKVPVFLNFTHFEIKHLFTLCFFFTCCVCRKCKLLLWSFFSK